jgi:hypothetical protein
MQKYVFASEPRLEPTKSRSALTFFFRLLTILMKEELNRNANELISDIKLHLEKRNSSEEIVNEKRITGKIPKSMNDLLNLLSNQILPLNLIGSDFQLLLFALYYIY